MPAPGSLDNLPLTRRHPGLTGRLPYVALGALPTPVEPLQLPQGAPCRAPRGGLWIKRDDQTGARYGGNKVRKLELLLGDALAQGHRAVWTLGAIGSHHALATAIYGEQVGLDVHILHTPQPLSAHVRHNLRALAATRARLTLLPGEARVPLTAARAQLRRWRHDGRPAYTIALGGSSPLGAVGYVNAAFELAEQIDAGLLPAPTHIYAPVGSCGTFAGLWLGCALAGLDAEVVGVRVVPRAVGNRLTSALLIHATSRLLHRLDPTVPLLRPAARRLTIRHAFAGPGYGLPTPRGRRAAELLSAMGVASDPTYTAKTASALFDALSRTDAPDGPVLYWNTLSSADLDAALGPLPGLDALPDAYRALLNATPDAKENPR